MSTVSNLDYNARFGANVSNIAAQARVNAAAARDVPVGATKYSSWFFGEENQSGGRVSKPKIRPIDIARMAAEEIAGVTVSNLSILGDENWDLFTTRLPAGHKLKKHIHASLIAKNVAPWLGSCKIGEVWGERKAGISSVQQFFIGNFNAEINTSGKGDIYQIKSKDFSQVFFGLHMLIDDNKRFLGFDLSKGDDGICFHTDNAKEAYYGIASAALGLTIPQLEEIARRNARLVA
ncbi:hypothetical protein ABUK73_20415 [Agrobacterium sp. BA1120]|uniref:hypothetical protein n=1 Tax=Agrobacterium sp. BA1120 TaxID=3228927 RepID=UPI00336A46A6